MPLAIHGGLPVIDWEIPRYNTIGAEELRSVARVVGSGNLSQFLGDWHDDFYGGPMVRRFEEEAAVLFGVKHALTVNSWTSGLVAAVGAIGIEPGDEVIVTPFTMAASATAILHWNAIPVFADVDPITYCISPESVEAVISPHTKAIMAVDIFGHPSDSLRLMEIASRHGLKVITDSAQAPGAKISGEFAGTLTDIGGFSLNYHKHIHTGEGGIVVTNDDLLAENVALIRNHAEAVVGNMGKSDLTNMIGFNFRMGEIEAAIGSEQLKKLPQLINSRVALAERLTSRLRHLEGLQVHEPDPGISHVYYVYPMSIDSDHLGVQRSKIVEALVAEGVPGLAGSYQNLHLLPLFQEKVAYGRSGFPWSAFPERPAGGYKRGITPIAERLHEETFMALAMCSFDFNENDIDAIANAFEKVWSELASL